MSRAEEDLDRVKKAAEILGEHFDSVMIFTTRHESGQEDGTVNVSFGAGNWFSRYGQVREWIVKCDERTRLAMQEES